MEMRSRNQNGKMPGKEPELIQKRSSNCCMAVLVKSSQEVRCQVSDTLVTANKAQRWTYHSSSYRFVHPQTLVRLSRLFAIISFHPLIAKNGLATPLQGN